MLLSSAFISLNCTGTFLFRMLGIVSGFRSRRLKQPLIFASVFESYPQRFSIPPSTYLCTVSVYLVQVSFFSLEDVIPCSSHLQTFLFRRRKRNDTIGSRQLWTDGQFFLQMAQRPSRIVVSLSLPSKYWRISPSTSSSGCPRRRFFARSTKTIWL